MNDDKRDGVFFEDGKYKVFVDGVYVKGARMEIHANNFYNKAKGGTTVPTPRAPRAPKVQATMPENVVEAVDVNNVFVPSEDPNFIPFGEFKDIERIVKSRSFFPVYITGPSGNGKSSMVEQACAKHGRKFIRLQINRKTDEDQLIGTKTLRDGNIEITEGPVLIAMREGAVLLLDEIDAGDPNEVMCLQSILEGKPYFFKLKNEMVYPAHGFTVFATGNTKGRGSDSGKYIGTEMLNEAFLERFPVTFCQEYPTQAIEKKIVLSAMLKYDCTDETFAEVLVRWSDAIRRSYTDGAVDDLITTRRILQIVQSYSIFKDPLKSVTLACNRFDDETAKSFVSIFDKIMPSKGQALAPNAETATLKTDENVPF